MSNLEHPEEGVAPESALPPEQFDLLQDEKMQVLTEELEKLDHIVDNQSYPLGEVPQLQMMDPKANLPLNSDALIASENIIESYLDEVGMLVQEEVGQIQKLQKSIDFWEDRIEKNKLMIEKNVTRIKHNNQEIVYDKKNRDYWWSRAEHVLLDYSSAEAASRDEDWNWLVKKYGFKHPDGTPIESDHPCIEELANGGASNLSGEYRSSGEAYEHAKKEKEATNQRLIRENAKFKATNETLQRYIQCTYSDKIEPLQDGVLLFKELSNKLKDLSSQSSPTFEDLRMWAEDFLNEFLRENPRTPQCVVTDFRRLASIPLPAENS